jgi:archaellum component FlaC
MPAAETNRSIEQLQNRIAAIKELPETVRSDLIVALSAARGESHSTDLRSRLDEALAILERETTASAEAAELAQAIRKLRSDPCGPAKHGVAVNGM